MHGFSRPHWCLESKTTKISIHTLLIYTMNDGLFLTELTDLIVDMNEFSLLNAHRRLQVLQVPFYSLFVTLQSKIGYTSIRAKKLLANSFIYARMSSSRWIIETAWLSGGIHDAWYSTSERLQCVNSSLSCHWFLPGFGFMVIAAIKSKIHTDHSVKMQLCRFRSRR